MRILLLFIILCKCFGLLFAEQIITKEYNAPRQGDILHKQKIEYIDPDDSGINILWDLRNVVVIDNDYETSYFTTDSLLALKDRKTCYYYKVIGDTLFGCGYNNYQTQMTDSIAPIEMIYPLRYGDKHFKDFHLKGKYHQICNIEAIGKTIIHADGIGTVLLPNNDTISNVIRVLKEHQSFVRINKNEFIYPIDTLTDSSLQHVEKTYQWYSEGYRYPIFETETHIYKRGDKNNGISEIVYNELNLPQSIYFNDGHITEYLYDADGNKLRVVYKIDNRTLYAPEEIGDLPDDESAIETIMTRDYIGNHVYEDGTLERTIIDNGYITETDTYNFYIKDYQGNNVLTIEENAAGVEGNHWDYNLYYPYGCPTRSIYSDRYMYSGKELDNMNGLRLYDFPARPYDAISTRFLSPDPLRSKYPHISPYAYCANNPVMYIDPTGCFIISKENAERYPKLNAYLYNRIKQITKNQHIMKHLIKYSEQSEDQIKRDFEYGKGPYINVFKFEDNAYGYFDASESKSTLNLDSDYVNMLETSSNLNSEIALFIIEVTILHEYVHYGDAQDGIDLTGEEGDQFEIATYGTIIDFNTATQLIIKYLENLHSNETQSQE